MPLIAVLSHDHVVCHVLEYDGHHAPQAVEPAGELCDTSLPLIVPLVTLAKAEPAPVELELEVEPPPVCPLGTSYGPTPGLGKFGVPSLFQVNCCVRIVLADHPVR